MTAQERAAALVAATAEVERLLEAGAADPDDALRSAVAALQARVPGWEWVGISFTDEGALLLGPWAGAERAPGEHPPLRVPIRFGGATVAELGVAGPAPEPGSEEAAALERLAALLAAHCLVGWDTGGVPWDEL